MWCSTLLLLAFETAAQTTSPDTRAIEEFQKRVAEYVKLRDKAKRDLGILKPTASADRIARHEKQLAVKIHQARGGITQGNIFTPEVAAALQRLTGNAMQAATVHQSLRRSEPVAVPIRVNRMYPNGVPFETTPPSLLAELPKLPSELEYRVVGHALVLRDVAANLVVDFLPKAIP